MPQRRTDRQGRGVDSTPICRCRVLYLGSAVPHVTKDGLQGIQQPLRQLYPLDGLAPDDAGLEGGGIDSWLSVWSNGLLLENVSGRLRRVTRFFPIETLHYCAAVRHVLVPSSGSNGASNSRTPRFLPLDSPFARAPHAPLFAAILRRTSGIKVLECHAFVCRRDAPANALVRCCFHAFADSVYARHVDKRLFAAIYSGVAPVCGSATLAGSEPRAQSVEQAHIDVESEQDDADGRTSSLFSRSVGDENHKVWTATPGHNAPDGPVFIESDPLPPLTTSESLHSQSTSRASRPRQRQMPATPAPPFVAVDAAFRRSASHPPPKLSRDSQLQQRHCRTRRVERRSQPPPLHHHHPQQQQHIMYSPPPPPPLFYTPHAVSPHVQLVPMLPAHYLSAGTVEEPAYLPSARASSPTASYQPSLFPYGAYLSQQCYGWHDTTDRRRRRHTTSSPGRRGVPRDRRSPPPENGYHIDYTGPAAGTEFHRPRSSHHRSIKEQHPRRTLGIPANGPTPVWIMQ